MAKKIKYLKLASGKNSTCDVKLANLDFTNVDIDSNGVVIVTNTSGESAHEVRPKEGTPAISFRGGEWFWAVDRS